MMYKMEISSSRIFSSISLSLTSPISASIDVIRQQLLIEDINDTIHSKMADTTSFIASAILSKSQQESARPDHPLTLSLSFRVEGSIRQDFSQKNWERAYNNHDNGFRMTIEVD